VKNPDIRTEPIEKIMGTAFPFADITMGIDALAKMMASKTQAVLVRDFKTDDIYIITRSDVIKALS
jgi:predicted transcriptional regulator